MRSVPGIVADSLARFRRSESGAAVRARLRAEARQRHAAELRGASFWNRLRLEGVIEREVRAELRRIHPPDALYAAGAAR
jgi:hypothetical protein